MTGMLGGDATRKCSHGVPLFEKGARCIDCEIGWELMVIERAGESIAKAKKHLEALKVEKEG